MDSQSTLLDFAAIGHQDNWITISDFINGIRPVGFRKLSIDNIKEIFSFIPPRDLFKVNVKSTTGKELNGTYIETFIDPDKLDTKFIKSNVAKVLDGISYANNLGPKIVALGGFTSIILEGNIGKVATEKTKFTTGNTLTAAFIVKGIEKAAIQKRINLRESNLLIVGATGDIGLACITYLKGIVKKLSLCARNRSRLEKLYAKLVNEGVQTQYSTNVENLSGEADIILCVASSSGITLSNCKKNVLICDAGYPKNLDSRTDYLKDNIFHGGMGIVSGGFSFSPDYSEFIYRYPANNIGHGCLLEAIVLAFEDKPENYSEGKGNITSERINEIYGMGEKHGISLAPFFNANGLW